MECPSPRKIAGWGSQDRYQQFGLGGDPFYFAQKWDTKDLQPVHKKTIRKVNFYPQEGVTYGVYIKQGNREYEESFTQLKSGKINSVTLKTPFVIDAKQDLLVAIHVISYANNTYPACSDEGPAVDGKGNLYSLDGKKWETFSDDELDANVVLSIVISAEEGEIIADKAHPYSLEVISHIGENTFTYDPSSLSWSIEDPTVCKIENGILTGIKNGTTNITGSIGNFSGNMKVTVEIPESPKIPADDFSGWTTKSISSITDATVTPSGNNQAILGFTYKTGRLPYVEMDKAITLYSIPDTLRMLINSEIPVSKIQIACKANGDKEQYFEYEGITVNEDYLISIPLSDITGKNNRGGFPVYLNYIKFYINTTGTNSGQAYKIHIKEFSLVYNGIESGIDETVAGNKNMVVYPNPITGNTLFLQGENIVPGSLIRIYDRVGALILEQLLDETGIVNIGDQQPGVYIVNVQNELGTHVCKIVIQ